jgi:hypothetical protein
MVKTPLGRYNVILIIHLLALDRVLSCLLAMASLRVGPFDVVISSPAGDYGASLYMARTIGSSAGVDKSHVSYSTESCNFRSYVTTSS